MAVGSNTGHSSDSIEDRRGLVIADQHTLDDTHWAWRRIERGLRIRALALDEGKVADVAVVLLSPGALKNPSVLTPANPSKGPPAVEGERVLAIGSPLHQEKALTTGIVSKVGADVLISDVNINHGSSSGPLLNLAGEVIGIATFGDVSTQGGPGISGVVAITKALPVLEKARSRIGAVPLPPTDLLPDVPAAPIPQSMISEAATKELEPYEVDGPATLMWRSQRPLLAPPRGMRGNGRSRRAGPNGSAKGLRENLAVRPQWFWQSYALDEADAVVQIWVAPQLKETSGSKWGGFLGAMVGVRGKTKLKFRDDFHEMELYRGGKLVLPIRPARVPMDVLLGTDLINAKDRAYGGVFFYDPGVFEPSESLVLRVKTEKDLQKWHESKIERKSQTKVWEEFAGYRASVATAQAPSK